MSKSKGTDRLLAILYKAYCQPLFVNNIYSFTRILVSSNITISASWWNDDKYVQLWSTAIEPRLCAITLQLAAWIETIICTWHSKKSTWHCLVNSKNVSIYLKYPASSLYRLDIKSMRSPTANIQSYNNTLVYKILIKIYIIYQWLIHISFLISDRSIH